MKSETTKIISGLLCIFSVTQRSRKFFFNYEIQVIYLQELWALWALSVQIAYGTITTKCLRLHVKSGYGVAKSLCVMTLCSWIKFDSWFLLMRYSVKLTQPAPLLDAAEFFGHVDHPLKLQDIQNSCQINCLLDQFCRTWLRKRLKMAYFSSIVTKFLEKVTCFRSQIR